MRILIADIQRQVAGFYRIRPDELFSRRVTRRVARPRQIAMYLARNLTQHSLPMIGQRFGRDHTTVIHAIRNIERLCAIDAEMAEDIETLSGRFA